ncbi:hypothetical protein ACHWQZ_G004327 [Mnemiopsis leidyi]
MAIFGNISWSYRDGRGRVQLYSNPVESAIVNNGFGVIYMVLILLSFAFNPLVFVQNYKRRRGTASFLFTILSGTDLTTSFLSLFTLFNLLSSEHSEDVVRPATSFEITIFMLSILSKLASSFITSLLSVTRFIKIRDPLTDIRKSWLVAYLTGTMVLVLGLLLRCVFKGPGHEGQTAWFPYQQMAMRELNVRWHIGLATVYVVNVLSAVVASFLTVKILFSQNNAISNKYTEKRNRGSSISIAIMNLGNLVFFAILISSIVAVSVTVKSKMYDYIGSGYAKVLARRGGNLIFILFCLVPDSLSVFNPVVFLYFNKNARKSACTKVSAAYKSFKSSFKSSKLFVTKTVPLSTL